MLTYGSGRIGFQRSSPCGNVICPFSIKLNLPGNYIIYGNFETDNNYIHNKNEEYNFLSYWIDLKHNKIDIYRESNGRFKNIIDKEWSVNIKEIL